MHGLETVRDEERALIAYLRDIGNILSPSDRGVAQAAYLAGWRDAQSKAAETGEGQLRAYADKLEGALSWIEPSFTDGIGPSELRQRINFCLADAKRARATLSAPQEEEKA